MSGGKYDYYSDMDMAKIVKSYEKSDDNTVVVTLASVPDNSRATVMLTGINGSATSVSASMGFLIGDVNSDGAIDTADLSAIKARSGQSTDQNNFTFDLNTSGVVTAADVAAVKARTPSTLQ